MNANWVKNQSEENIIKELKEEYKNNKYDIDFLVKSDDGGRHIEAKVIGQNNSSDLRKKLPLNYNGWRTIVSYTPLETVLKKKD